MAARWRTLPLAAMLSVVAVAVVVRMRVAPPRASSDDPASAPNGVTSTHAGPAPPASGLAAPLRALPFAWSEAASEAGATAAGPTWTRMIHGGPRHSHRAAARGPAKPKVGWRTSLGAAISAQVTTSADEQTLYAATHDGSLVALARADGAKRWTVTLGERVYSTPFIADDGTLYVGSDAKKLAAIDRAGNVKWRLEVDGEIDSGPVLAPSGNVVFAAGAGVYAVRPGGDLAWRLSTRGKVYTSPALTPDGLVVVGAQDHVVRAIGPSGDVVWSTDLGADVDGSPAVGDDGAVYVGTDKGEVVRLDGRGAVVWRAGIGGFVRGVLSVSRTGDVLAGTYGPVPRVVRISPEGVVRGAFAIQGTGAREFGIHGGPLEDGEGTLYFGAQDDEVRAIGVDGALRWRFATGADVDAPLTMLSDGSLVVASEDGTITMLLP